MSLFSLIHVIALDHKKVTPQNPDGEVIELKHPDGEKVRITVKPQRRYSELTFYLVPKPPPSDLPTQVALRFFENTKTYCYPFESIANLFVVDQNQEIVKIFDPPIQWEVSFSPNDLRLLQLAAQAIANDQDGIEARIKRLTDIRKPSERKSMNLNPEPNELEECMDAVKKTEAELTVLIGSTFLTIDQQNEWNPLGWLAPAIECLENKPAVRRLSVELAQLSGSDDSPCKALKTPKAIHGRP
jgi:hypothetical protein